MEKGDKLESGGEKETNLLGAPASCKAIYLQRWPNVMPGGILEDHEVAPQVTSKNRLPNTTVVF